MLLKTLPILNNLPYLYIQTMELSIVIPVFHSAKNALRHLPDVLSTLQGKFQEFEIIFIIDNDDVNDELKALLSLKERYDEVKIYQLNKNHGQHFATLSGYYFAKGDFIMSIDEDMTEYISVICTTDAYKKSDAMYFFYDKDKMYNSNTRKILSNVYKNLIYKIVNLKKHSTFRSISKPLRDKMLQNKHIFWNVDVMIFNNTDDIGSYEVRQCTITDHYSGYNYKKLFQFAFEIAYEHNTIFMNMLLAIIPTAIYYIINQDILRTAIVYLFTALVITTFFNTMKFFSPDTDNKILNALKEE